MKRTTRAAAIAVVCAGLASPAARAADHQDGPAAKADPSTDITDLFAWMSATGDKVYLVMDVFPAADKASSKFSSAAKYAFHTEARDSFGSTTLGARVDVICTFDASQKISCWAVDRAKGTTLDYLNGDASSTAGLTSASGKVKVFAGPRDDPFFFNLDGFKDVAAVLTAAKANLKFNDAGCPTIDAATSAAAVKILGGTMNGAQPAVNHFAGLNVLAIVVAIDKSLLTTATAPLLSVWASTNK